MPNDVENFDEFNDIAAEDLDTHAEDSKMSHGLNTAQHVRWQNTGKVYGCRR